jgi:hypothetical protein
LFGGRFTTTLTATTRRVTLSIAFRRKVSISSKTLSGAGLSTSLMPAFFGSGLAAGSSDIVVLLVGSFADLDRAQTKSPERRAVL